MERIVITLGERSCPITIASGLLNGPAPFLPLKSGERVMLVINGTLAPLYLDKVRGVPEQTGVNVSSVILPDGEQYKSLAVLDIVSTTLLQKPHGRDTILVVLDGGIVGDLIGFAAASYRCDVRFIQAPATLLLQVDSSVGDKTTVNYPPGKNMIGTFYQPASMVMDLNCLKTFPPRKLTSGLAEVTKHGIIPDGAFSNWLEGNLNALPHLDGPAMAYYIRRYCELKAEAIAADERETGLCVLLNLGCTFGYTIEAEMRCGSQLHGETVAAGMVMMARTSERLGQFSSAEAQRTITLLTRAGLLVNGPREMSAQVYLPHMLRDKKVLVGEMRLVLPLTIGKSEVRSGVSHEFTLNAIIDRQSAQQQKRSSRLSNSLLASG